MLVSLFVFLSSSSNSFGKSADIEWELIQPFKFITDEGIYSTIKNEYNSLTNQEKEVNPALSLQGKLHSATFNGRKYLKNGWTASIAKDNYTATCWNANSATYNSSGKCANFIHPNAHDINVWLKDSPYSDNTKCEWKYGETIVVKQCNERLLVKDVPYPQGINIVVTPVLGENNESFSTTIKVVDKLVVGLGDSYASGEGNPDVPVKFQGGRVNKDHILTENLYTPKKDKNNYAIWADRRSHRSLYSYQFDTALVLALENPKQAITFLSYSCSGAKVEHILSEWKHATENKKMRRKDRWISKGDGQEQVTYDRSSQIMPQIEALTRDLKCPPNWGGVCKKGTREVDLVLLSIGGNDIGFTNYVINIATPERGAVSNLAARKPNDEKIKKALNNLTKSYKNLSEELANTLPIKNCSDRMNCKNVILTTYPNILNDENGMLCTDDREAFLIPFGTDDNRGIRIKETLDKVIVPLQKTQNNLIDQGIGWSIVNSHNESYRIHGLCSKDVGNMDKANEIFTIPHKKNKSEPSWKPFSPNEYYSYGKMQRWVRLPVDSKLSINMTKGGMDWLYSDESSGIVHPNAYGHASTADANLKVIRDLK